MLFGPETDSAWHGGALAIFDNARNATLIDVADVNHFTIAGTDEGSQMKDLAEYANEISGLNFNQPERPYRNIPTLEYAVAFLDVALDIRRTQGESKLQKASSDPRLVKVESSR